MTKVTAPYPYTCPLIDDVKEEIGRARDKASILEEKLNEFEGASFEELAQYWKGIKQAFANMNDCIGVLEHYSDTTMENIRSTNHDLRTWGEQQADRVKDLEDEIDAINAE